jgi:hypothetical protein
MYLKSSTGLSPECVHFDTDVRQDGPQERDEMFVVPDDDFNLLRPETVESLMILHRVMGDEVYREYGRRIMAAFERHAKLPTGGYRSLWHVFNGPGSQPYSATMESFFLAETLKYLFLLFSDADVLPLDEIVFNTEAHPLLITS